MNKASSCDVPNRSVTGSPSLSQDGGLASATSQLSLSTPSTPGGLTAALAAEAAVPVASGQAAASGPSSTNPASEGSGIGPGEGAP